MTGPRPRAGPARLPLYSSRTRISTSRDVLLDADSRRGARSPPRMPTAGWMRGVACAHARPRISIADAAYVGSRSQRALAGGDHQSVLLKPCRPVQRALFPRQTSRRGGAWLARFWQTRRVRTSGRGAREPWIRDGSAAPWPTTRTTDAAPQLVGVAANERSTPKSRDEPDVRALEVLIACIP